MPTESQKLQILIKDRAPSTKRKYLGQLDTIQRALGGDVELATLDQILYFLNRTPNPHTRATYINIMGMLRRDLRHDLSAIRMENLDLVRDHVAHTNSQRTPPTFEALCIRRDLAFDRGEWAKFLCQALTIEFGLRTMDLDMVISDKENRDTYKNHLIRHGAKLDYYRNRYKTVSWYRAKHHHISDPRMIHAAKQLPLGPFTTKVVNCHPDRTGEADYFRAQIEYLVRADPNVIQKIHALASSRGTSWQQISTNYNLRMDANL